nr:methionine--tRNA ligase [Candidatus Woesearchaeota archaeon]
MTKKKFYITTPIYYANAEPHIGSAYTTIAADILARWHRLKGEEVFFLTGTDEHGQKIQETAEQKNINPNQFVDNIADKFKKTFNLLNISNDNFIRTTNKKHEEEVKKILQELYDKKFIYKGYYEAYYCVGCEQYKTPSDLVDGKCPLHNRELELRREEAYLFKLSSFQKKLLDLIKTEKYLILPKKRRNEVISFIERGLNDISFSRLKEKVYWGIELPFDKNHTCFVWVDAFWNYLTGLIEKNEFKKFWPPDVQLMANDILRVHATIWPALLLATKNKLPKTLFIHGYFTVNRKKMSKSLGNAISPDYLAGKYGPDGVRYFLIREIPFGEDGDFSEIALKERLNNELANDLGNLVSRILTLTEKNFKNGLKKTIIDKNLSSKLDINKIDSYIEKYELHNALNEVWKFINECNKHINQEQPWKMQGKELEKHLYTLTESIRIISILISPFIPETSEKIFSQLNVKCESLNEAKFGLIKEYKIKKGKVLFKKVI